MASILKENEIRVNATCISISRSLYERVISSKDMRYARVSHGFNQNAARKYGLSYDNTKGKTFNITFFNDYTRGISIDTVSSNYQISFDHNTINESHQGFYKYIVTGINSMRIEKI